MKENLVSLAKLLATEDAFNLAFSSQGTDEEKYELAKTKFTDLTREDFSEFMEKLREAEKANLAELSPDELKMVAGGAGGWATKLAAATMLVTALGATGVMSQQADAARPNFYAQLDSEHGNDFVSARALDSLLENKIKKGQNVMSLKRSVVQDITSIADETVKQDISNTLTTFNAARKKLDATEATTLKQQIDSLQSVWDLRARVDQFKQQRAFYEQLYSDIVAPTIDTFNATAPESQVIHGFTLSRDTLQHIMLGDWSDPLAIMGGGGHTQQALDLATNIVQAKMDGSNDNPMREQFCDQVLQCRAENPSSAAFTVQKEFTNGVRIVKYFDSACEHRDKKTIFPKTWKQEDIVEAIRDCLPSSEKSGLPLDCARHNRQFFIGKSNGVYVGVVVDTSRKEVVTAYPLDNQEPHFENGRQMLTIEDPASTSLTNARTIDVDVTDLN